jgi:protocatechuate 3,4-dioxygenase beta subunit
MRPLHSLLVAVFVALACVGGWFLVGSSDQRVEVASAAPGPIPSTPSAAAPTGALQTPLAPQAGQRSELTPEPQQANASQGAKTEGEEGTLAVTGRVVDASGAPVAGARVLASSVDGGMQFLGSFPLDARGAGEMSWLKRTETTSGSDGRFQLHGLRPGSMRLAVRGAGYAPYDESNRALPSGTSFDLGSIQLEPGVYLAGKVVDARGQAVEGADVLRLAEPGQAEFGGFFGGAGVPVAKTAADGSFALDQLAPGPWALRVESEFYPHARLSGETSHAGEHVDGLVIALEEGLEIHGIVRGAPAGESFSVRAVPRGAQSEGEGDEEVHGPGGEPREVAMAPDGTFQLRGLRRNLTYEIGLTRARQRNEPFAFFWAPGLAEPVRARPGDLNVVLDYQPESALVFQALDKRTNKPIEEFTVEAGIDWPMPQMGEDGRRVRAHPEGRARVGNLRPKSPSDRAQLRIAAVGYSPFESDDLPLATGQDTDLGPIYLEPLPLLTVKVLDAASGEPLSAANVVLSAIDPQQGMQFGRRVELDISAEAGEDAGDMHFGGDRNQRARTDEQGVARLTIPVGSSCRLSVRHGEHAPWRSEIFAAPSEAAEREVRLGPGGTVVAHVKGPEGGPVAGGRVEHQAPGADGGFSELGFGGHGEVTDERGEVRFEHLEPGTHRFRLAKGSGDGFFSDPNGAYAIHVGGFDGGGRGWVQADVAEGAETKIEIQAPVEVLVEGRVREAGEALSGATVQLALKGEDEGMPRLPFGGGGGPKAQTDGQGRYRLEGVEPGEYTLTVRHPSRAMESEETVSVREVDLHHDVDLSVAIVEGKVTDAAGKPLSGVRVWPVRAQPEARQAVRILSFAATDGGGSMVSFDEGGVASVQSRTDADGRYQLRGVTPDAELQVRAEGKGLQPASSDPFRVAHDEVRRNVDLTLQTAGSIEVHAQRSDGSPARNLLVTARLETPPGGSDAGEQRNEFLGEERLLLDGLAPGMWRLSARPLGPSEADVPDDQVVEVKAGETSQATFKVR